MKALYLLYYAGQVAWEIHKILQENKHRRLVREALTNELMKMVNEQDKSKS